MVNTAISGSRPKEVRPAFGNATRGRLSRPVPEKRCAARSQESPEKSMIWLLKSARNPRQATVVRAPVQCLLTRHQPSGIYTGSPIRFTDQYIWDGGEIVAVPCKVGPERCSYDSHAICDQRFAKARCECGRSDYEPGTVADGFPVYRRRFTRDPAFQVGRVSAANPVVCRYSAIGMMRCASRSQRMQFNAPSTS